MIRFSLILVLVFNFYLLASDFNDSYDQLIANYLNEKAVVKYAQKIDEYLKDNPNFDIKNFSLKKAFKDHEEAEILSTFLSIIDTPNFPQNKKILWPLINTVLEIEWGNEEFAKIFFSCAKLQSSKFRPLIEKALEKIEQNFSNDNFYDLEDIAKGLIDYLFFLQKIKTNISKTLQNVIELILNRLQNSEKLNHRYLALRIMKNEQNYQTEERLKITSKLEASLAKNLKELKRLSLEDKIYLFTSFFYLNDLDVLINAYFKKICILQYHIIENSEYKNISSDLKDTHFLAVLSFNNFDNNDFGIAKLSSYAPCKRILLVKEIMLGMDDTNKNFIKNSLFKVMRKLIPSQINILSASDITRLEEICDDLEFTELKIILKNNIKSSYDLIKKQSSKELVNTNILQIRKVFLENDVLKLLLNHNAIDISNFCTIQEYKAGKVIFREGDKDRGAFVILGGQVALSIDDKIVGSLMRPHFFGEFSLFSKRARSATATALTDVILIKIDHEIYNEMAKKNPELLEPLKRHLRIMVENTNTQRGKIENISEKVIGEELILDRKKLIDQIVGVQNLYKKKAFKVIANILSKPKYAKKIKKLIYKPGVICSYGDPCHHIILILEGSIEAKIGEAVLKKYGMWELLGEMNIFEENPKRTAEVISAGNEGCIVLEIPLDIFEKKVGKDPSYLNNLIKNLIRMVRQNNKYNY